jgi:glutamate carboxypeptidase
MRVLAVSLGTILLAIPPLAAQDHTVERAIVRHVDARRAEAVVLLEQAVNINSFATSWIDGSPFARAGHLVAERTGSGPRLLLIGHLDTVFELGSPFQRFERGDDSTARGPGVIDMKGGDVVMLEALSALDAAGALERMNVRVIMTGDEELTGRPIATARAALVEAADWADVAIAFENGDSDPRTAVISRRGSSSWQLVITGRPAHSSQVFTESVGAGAIFEAARILHRFYDDLSTDSLLTFNPGVVLAGTDVVHDSAQSRGTAFGKGNVVAGHAVVSGDLRAISPDQLAQAQARMRAIVGEHLPLTTAEITFDHSYPPLAPTDGNRRLLALFDRVSRDLGFGPVTAVDPRKAGAADVSFTTGRVAMAIDGLGPGGADDHTVDETIDLRTLPMQAKRAAVLLYRLSTGAIP